VDNAYALTGPVQTRQGGAAGGTIRLGSMIPKAEPVVPAGLHLGPNGPPVARLRYGIPAHERANHHEAGTSGDPAAVSCPVDMPRVRSLGGGTGLPHHAVPVGRLSGGVFPGAVPPAGAAPLAGIATPLLQPRLDPTQAPQAATAAGSSDGLRLMDDFKHLVSEMEAAEAGAVRVEGRGGVCSSTGITEDGGSEREESPPRLPPAAPGGEGPVAAPEIPAAAAESARLLRSIDSLPTPHTWGWEHPPTATDESGTTGGDPEPAVGAREWLGGYDHSERMALDVDWPVDAMRRVIRHAEGHREARLRRCRRPASRWHMQQEQRAAERDEARQARQGQPQALRGLGVGVNSARCSAVGEASRMLHRLGPTHYATAMGIERHAQEAHGVGVGSGAGLTQRGGVGAQGPGSEGGSGCSGLGVRGGREAPPRIESLGEKHAAACSAYGGVVKVMQQRGGSGSAGTPQGGKEPLPQHYPQPQEQAAAKVPSIYPTGSQRGVRGRKSGGRQGTLFAATTPLPR